MTKPEWGTKRTCKQCSAVFYDMKKNPIICPKCQAQFTLADFSPAALLAEKVAASKVADTEEPDDIIDEFKDSPEDDLIPPEEELLDENLEDMDDIIEVEKDEL